MHQKSLWCESDVLVTTGAGLYALSGIYSISFSLTVKLNIGYVTLHTVHNNYINE